AQAPVISIVVITLPLSTTRRVHNNGSPATMGRRMTTIIPLPSQLIIRAMFMLQEQASVQHGLITTMPRSSTTHRAINYGSHATTDRGMTWTLRMPLLLTPRAMSMLPDRVAARVVILIMRPSSTTVPGSSNGSHVTTDRVMLMTKPMALLLMPQVTCMGQETAAGKGGGRSTTQVKKNQRDAT